jgi:hypothetical protein
MSGRCGCDAGNPTRVTVQLMCVHDVGAAERPCQLRSDWMGRVTAQHTEPAQYPHPKAAGSRHAAAFCPKVSSSQSMWRAKTRASSSG